MSHPVNNLEISFQKAMKEDTHRPQFYRDLLRSDVLLITEGQPEKSPKEEEEAGQLRLQAWPRDGIDWIPFFSSLTRMKECVDHNTNYLEIKAQTFLETTRGSHLVMNPNSEFCKEFSPTEVEGFLKSL